MYILKKIIFIYLLKTSRGLDADWNTFGYHQTPCPCKQPALAALDLVILHVLMPYPCSHFYFDIKFGDRLYSKEKLSSSFLNIICRQNWYQSKSDYMDRALGAHFLHWNKILNSESHDLGLLSLYTFWGKCVYFSIFEW